jgi:hypothetical protein
VKQAKADAVAAHGPNSSDRHDVEDQFAGLQDDDRLCSLDMPGIPRVSEFESITTGAPTSPSSW